MPGISFSEHRSMGPKARNCSLAFVALVLSLTASPAFAQQSLRTDDLNVIRNAPLEKEFDEMLFKYLMRLADEATEKRLARLEAIRTDADFKDWQETNRNRFLELIGGLPPERTPLNARVLGEISRPGYLVRRVVFESLPEFYVTANLYVPTTGRPAAAGKPPFPAVLAPVGHATNAKAYVEYQRLFIGLVERGYVVLTWDPLGQGERIQYWDVLANRRTFEFNQHSMAGIQEYLLGQNLARYFIWDGVRALDYLVSLPEVDASRIGVTGNSGGGTQTAYIAMLDPRVKAASIVTFITSLPKRIENRANDAEAEPEQDLYGLLAAGIDHAEFVGMIAPRPVLIGAAMHDFFPIEGTRKTFGELQKLYAKLGAPERIKMVEFDHQHMYSQPLREATTAWFDLWLKGEAVEAHEPEIQLEQDKTLECSPTGQVETSWGGKRVYDFNRAEAERALAALRRRRGEPEFRRALASRIRERLVIPSSAPQPRARKVSESEVAGLAVEKVLVETEPGIAVPVRLVHAREHAAGLHGIVYLRDREGNDDSPEFIETLSRGGALVAVADVRGFGETKSSRNVPERRVGYFDPRDGMDADFTFAAFFLGRTLLGMRVWDALNVAEYLRSRPEIDAQRISIAGRGWAGVIGLFAAALDPKISAVVAVEPLASYGEVARSELYEQPVSLMPPGILRDFDMEDVLASLAPRPLLVLNPTDALARKMIREQAQRSLSTVAEAYRQARAENAISFRVSPFEPEARDALARWLLEH